MPAEAVNQVANLPPTGASFAAFLGYDPMKTLLPPSIIQQLPAASQDVLFSKTFLSNLIGVPFDDRLRIAFIISILLALVAAGASLMSGRRFIYEEENRPQLVLEDPANPVNPAQPMTEKVTKSRKQ